MKPFLLSVLFLLLLLSHDAFATGITPVVIMENGNKVISLSVSNEGDESWIWRDFGDSVDTGEHNVITVSFDMFLSVGFSQQMIYSMVDESGSTITVDGNYYYGNNDPYYGIVGSEKTLPLGYSDKDPGTPGPNGLDSPIDHQVNTVSGDWVNITIEWEFDKIIGAHPHVGYVSAWYDTDSSGNPVAVVLNLPIDPVDNVLAETLNGWDMYLVGIVDGFDSVLIDNLVITGSDIYNSYGFENFNLGALHGQDGWLTGTETGATVPEPTTMLFFGTGIAGLAAIARRRK